MYVKSFIICITSTFVQYLNHTHNREVILHCTWEGKDGKKKCSTVLIQLWINYILFYFSLEKVTRAMFMFRRRTNLNSDLLLCIWWTSLRLQVFVYCCHWLLGISTFSWTNKSWVYYDEFSPSFAVFLSNTLMHQHSQFA